jgi:hypothetical protein
MGLQMAPEPEHPEPATAEPRASIQNCSLAMSFCDRLVVKISEISDRKKILFPSLNLHLFQKTLFVFPSLCGLLSDKLQTNKLEHSSLLLP